MIYSTMEFTINQLKVENMKVTTNNKVLFDKVSPVSMCTGSIADKIDMQPGDFKRLLDLSKRDMAKFNAVIGQLENRFKENRH